MSSTWLVAGLGNPGPAYAATRHNVGHMVVDEMVRRAGGKYSSARSLRADICSTRVSTGGVGGVGADADRVILLRPRTYMNESGASVGKAAPYYRVPPERIIVIHDELDLDLGQLRLKLGGGDAGHNGLRSIRAALGSGEFLRIRFGIGRPPGRQEPADYVLRPIPASLREDYAVQVQRAADAVIALISDGLVSAQNEFNS